jgi:hypothetical protein
MESIDINHAAQTVFDGLDTTVKLKYKTPPTYLIAVCLEKHLVAEFSLSTDTMFITAIHKHKGVSGSIILDKVELFARTVGVKTISLNDNSRIYIRECDDVDTVFGYKNNMEISLQTLYLLTAGMSWYNSKGYVDETMDSAEGDHQGIRTDDINVRVGAFMQKVIVSLIENQNFVYYKANRNTFEDTVDTLGNSTNYIYQLLSRINAVVPELHIDLLVKDYFNIVKTLLKTPNPSADDCRLFMLFKELFMFIDDSLLLRRDLNGSTKILAGIKGRRKGTCKKCLQNKKHRHNNSKKMQKSKKKRQILTFNLNDIK